MTDEAITCLPIKCSGFLPLITERNKMASAFGDIWFMSPGKIITGSFVAAFTTSSEDSKSPLSIKLPPNKNPSTPDCSQNLTKTPSLSFEIFSGSSNIKYAAPFTEIVFKSCSYIFILN